MATVSAVIPLLMGSRKLHWDQSGMFRIKCFREAMELIKYKVP